MTMGNVSLIFPAAYQAEVLAEAPAAEMERFEFCRTGEDARGDLLVEVATKTGGWWLASIRPPASSLRGAVTSIHSTPSPSVMCVVVGGDAVLIDVRDPAKYEWVDTAGPVVTVRSLVRERLLLLATPWAITAVGRDGVRWRTERLSIEGLRLDEVADGWLAGVADPGDDEPRDFAIDLRTGSHRGGAPAAWS